MNLISTAEKPHFYTQRKAIFFTPGEILSFKHVNLLGLGKHYLTARHANIGNFRVSLSQQLICSLMNDDFKKIIFKTNLKKICIAIAIP